MTDQPVPDFEEARRILERHKVALIHGPDGELSERRAWLNSRETAAVLDALRVLLSEREALRRALGAYAVTLRSGERESPQIRALYDKALAATDSAQPEQPTSEAGS